MSDGSQGRLFVDEASFGLRAGTYQKIIFGGTSWALPNVVESAPGKVITFRPVQTYLYVEVSGQIHAQAALSTCTYWIGDWVDTTRRKGLRTSGVRPVAIHCTLN